MELRLACAEGGVCGVILRSRGWRTAVCARAGARVRMRAGVLGMRAMRVGCVLDESWGGGVLGRVDMHCMNFGIGIRMRAMVVSGRRRGVMTSIYRGGEGPCHRSPSVIVVSQLFCWLAASLGGEERICVAGRLLGLTLDPAGNALLLCNVSLVSLRRVVVFCHN